MKRAIFIVLLFFAAFAYCNEHVKIDGAEAYEYHDHETYEVWFDTTTKNPAVVVWDLTIEDVVLSDQSKNRPDSKFSDCGSAKHAKENYYKSGYDRGHMCPNNDRDWSKAAAKNTFRACNICPQLPEVNRKGDWRNYENYGHKLAKEHMLVTIVCGPYYDSTIGPRYIEAKDNIRIPDGFFKAFVYKENGQTKVAAFKFKQSTDKCIVSGMTLDWLKQMTGLTILVND